VKREAPQVGEVIPYWFLWHSEHEAGEESGCKLRPCVVAATLSDTKGATRVAVVPVTHRAPTEDRSAVEIPAQVKSQLGLSVAPSWIICDEFNEFVWPGFDLGKTSSGRATFGFLPRGVIAQVRSEAAAARTRGRLKQVSRDP
jgi:hypothetical protein